MSKMIECTIDSIRVSLTNQDRIVVLKERDAQRYLPIWIGVFESEAITIALQRISVARPLTHDLLKTLLNILEGQLIAVEITLLENDTYYANLVIEQSGTRKYVDCRPSDALALVVRTGVPIFVDEEVLDSAGIRPEDTEGFEEEPTIDEALPGANLSAFEDFLKDLNLNKPQADDPDPEQPLDE
ncbi:MAG: bifunctional nuclease family protein [Anaerolineaceae bacterium]|jgi:bifunctional DNase/RNase